MQDDEPPQLYLEPFKRLLKSYGKRSSDESVEKLKEAAEEYSDKIAKRAAELAEHADRKTIQEQDMEKAIRQLKQE